MRIADVAMTGEWEKELACIERGEVPAGKFRKEIEEYATSITSELLSCEKLFGKKDSGCTCPKCGTGRMQFFGKVVRCDNTECGLPIFRLKANRMLTDDEIRELLTKGKTGVLKGFKTSRASVSMPPWSLMPTSTPVLSSEERTVRHPPKRESEEWEVRGNPPFG